MKPLLTHRTKFNERSNKDITIRLTTIAPIIFTGIAVIISYLCVFAGTNSDMIEDADILLLNTSRIAVNFLNQTSASSSSDSDSSPSSWIDGLIHNATHSASSEANKVENELESALNDKLQSIAHDLGLHDFYSVHILNYCEGFFKGNSSHRNVTSCTNSSASFSFDPTQTISNELNKSASAHPKFNITLEDLHWPGAVTEGIQDVRWLFHIMYFMYCFGLFFISLSFVGAVSGLFHTHGRLLPLINVGLGGVACGFLALASAAVTFAGKHVVDAINEYGEGTNINAVRGEKFLRMTWVAVALIALSTLWWMGELAMTFKKGEFGGRSSIYDEKRGGISSENNEDQGYVEASGD